jgi:hypothetical protein
MLYILSATWKELLKSHGRLCKKLMGISYCAANGFAEMEFGRDSRIGMCTGQIVKYWYRTMCLDPADPVKRCYEWQKSDMNASSWPMELTQELYNIGLAFV